MKYKANIELDLNGEDVLEKETLNAVRAYAKTVARDVMDKQIDDEIDKIAKKYVESLYKINYLNESRTDGMIRKAATEYIKNQVNAHMVRSVALETMHEYLDGEWKKLIDNGVIEKVIREIAKEQLPNLILDALKSQ